MAGRIPVTIVLADGSGPHVIFRRAGIEPRNVILVNADFDAERLSNAVFAFLLAEARDPDGLERADNKALRLNLPPGTPAYAGAEQAVNRLKNAGRRGLPGLGVPQRTIEIWVAPRRGLHR